MKIEALKINGVPAPLGFALPFVPDRAGRS